MKIYDTDFYFSDLSFDSLSKLRVDKQNNAWVISKDGVKVISPKNSQEIKNLKKRLNQLKAKLQVEELVLNMVHQHNHIICNMDMDQQKLDLDQVNLN